jgi:hypothetical protein
VVDPPTALAVRAAAVRAAAVRAAVSDGAAGVRAEGWPHFAERRIGEGSPALDKRDEIDNVSYLSDLICSRATAVRCFIRFTKRERDPG